MQKLLLSLLLLALATVIAMAQDNSAQFDPSRLVFTSISGPTRKLVIYAPKPMIPPIALQQHLNGRGIYKLDLDNGTPYDVRVIRSTGHKILDDAAVEALRKWRFLPHGAPWVTIPIEFGRTKQPSP